MLWTKVYVLLMVFWGRGDEGEGTKREIEMAKGLGACKGIAVAINFVVYRGRAFRHWGGIKPLYCQEDDSLPWARAHGEPLRFSCTRNIFRREGPFTYVILYECLRNTSNGPLGLMCQR